jgi:hypothetical protein
LSVHAHYEQADCEQNGQHELHNRYEPGKLKIFGNPLKSLATKVSHDQNAAVICK